MTERIQQNFSRAVKSYDQVASWQKASAERLSHWLPENGRGFWLDLGCGTGQQSQFYINKLKQCEWILADLSKQMAWQASQLTAKPAITTNAQHLSLKSNSIDGLTSNLVLQWTQPELVLAEIKRVLKPGASAYLCTLIEGSFSELNSAFAPEPAPVNLLHSVGQWFDAASQNKLEVARQQQFTLSQSFDSVKAALRSFKQLGARKLPGQNRLHGKSHWFKVLKQYPQNISGQYELSYQLLLLQLQKN